MITVRTQKRPARRRGQTSSEDWNDFQDEVISDLGNMAKTVSDLQAQLVEDSKIHFSESEANRAKLQGLEAEALFRDKNLATQDGTITAFQDFRTFERIRYASLSQERRMRVDPRYGQAILPYNRLVHLFFTPNIEADGTTIAPNLEITVTPVAEDGAVQIVEGTTRKAFDGHNQSYWLRTVEYPADSDVTEVRVRLEIAVPQSIIDFANLVTVHPYPLGQLDLLGIWFSASGITPDPIDANLIPGFTQQDSAEHFRLHFADTQITNLLIEFRQRNFIEREGKKVFQYGAQEISLQLVEFDQTTEVSPHAASVGALNGVVSIFAAPDGFRFDLLNGFFADPVFPVTGGPSGRAPVFHRIFVDAALTQEVWNSFTDALPQDVNVDLSTHAAVFGLTRIWVLTTARFDEATGLAPVVNNIGIQYKVKPT